MKGGPSLSSEEWAISDVSASSGGAGVVSDVHGHRQVSGPGRTEYLSRGG